MRSPLPSSKWISVFVLVLLGYFAIVSSVDAQGSTECNRQTFSPVDCPPSSETWTYWTIQRLDGTSYGEGKGVIMTKDGTEVATATGRGEGRMTDAGKMKYPGAIFYETNSKNKLAFLNHLIGVNEYEVDTMGNYVHKLWEWK